MGPEVEAAINELMAISGKPRELCLQALQAAQGLPDLAFEFLLSGNIPQVPQPGHGQQHADNDAGMDDEGDYGEEGVGMDTAGLSTEQIQAIQALVNNPSFPMIRQRLIQDPSFSQ